MYYRTRSFQLFAMCNYVLLSMISVLCILPMLHIFAVSLSNPFAAEAGAVKLWPIGFNFSSYAITLSNDLFLTSIWNSLERTALGTLLSMALTVLAAYPLSMEDTQFRARTTYVWIFVITMLFSGGLVPTYIVVQKLGLMNTVLALVLPGAVAVFNIVLMLNFFRSVPKALAEAAYLDGAGHLRTLISVYIPISMPAVATLSLFSMVHHWNSWFDGLLYLTDKRQYPMATLLQMIIAQLDPEDLRRASTDDSDFLSDRTVKAAQIFVATVPILLAYPFLQRYFVHGIKLGSVKE